jgi:2-oxoglutarate dehydrogenase E2 component (dihydrolipoamide succinyltransferase)
LEAFETTADRGPATGDTTVDRGPQATPVAASTIAGQPPQTAPTGAATTDVQRPQNAAMMAPAGDGRTEERVRMSRRRRTIAQRLVEAQQTAAMLTTFNEIDMTAVMELRKRRGEEFQKRYEVKLGFMSFFVKASLAALKAFPEVNAEIQGDEIVLKHYYDIGIAIGAEEGLVVPVLKDADRMTFAGIEQKIGDYVERTKAGTLTLDDLRGGTFTITNGGVFGSLMSTPILMPPQVAILGMHKIEKRPVAINDEVVIRPMMYVALSYDHRIVDGKEAVQFLVRVKELIEDPESMLLEG